MPVSKIGTNALASGLDVSSTNISYTGTLTGGTGVVNLGSGQVYKDALGNVGIGVTPSAWGSGFRRAVQVGSSASFAGVASGASDYMSMLGNAFLDSGPTYRYIHSTTAVRYEASAAEHRWYTAPSGTAGNAISFTQAMTLDSSGNLLVGRTTTASFSSSTTSGFTWQGGSVCTISAASTDPLALQRSGSDGAIVTLWKGTSQVGSISVTASATAYNTSSDYRLKHDIAPMTGALARVAALKPVTYKWNVDDSAGEGFIAHELAEVCPQAVTGEKDAVDAEGNPVYQGIDTSFLVATLTAAIQELKAELDSVKAELAALKGA